MKTKFKIAAAIVIVVTASIHLIVSGYGDWDAGGNLAYVLGLLFLFFSREQAQDERVQILKLKALTVAFCVGYVVTFGVKVMPPLTSSRGPAILSAYDFMFVALTAALLLFYFWHWRDGRSEVSG